MLSQPTLEWIASQQNQMIELLESWANINSSSHNLDGLSKMLSALESAYSILGGQIEKIPLKPIFKIDSKGEKISVQSASALRIRKHPKAPVKVFLGGHMDTVYPIESPFQKTKRINANTIQGPGVADMKGGLVILLKVLEAIEKSPIAGKIGWEVLINPDEEIGSQASEHLFIEGAKRNQIGLLFEPSFADGAMVTERKGSANFAIIARGRAAHAGRDFHHGRNAIMAIMRFIHFIERLNEDEGITVNIGQIEGGGPINIVPDLAICHFNIRCTTQEDFSHIHETLQQAISNGNKTEGISLSLHQLSDREPKPFDTAHRTLFEKIQVCANELGLKIEGRASGGVCDGNILSAQGLPTIDTLGIVGGNIHTSEEYALLSSLTERASLAASFLMALDVTL